MFFVKKNCKFRDSKKIPANLEIALVWETVVKLFIYMAKPQSSMMTQS